MSPRSLRDALSGWVHTRLSSGTFTGIRRRAALGLRTLLVASGDPPVRFELAGAPLLLPLSHDLPQLRARFPLYSSNLTRLTSALVARYDDLAVVDIGANVGDSVALIRAAAPVPVLCVEGDPHYLEFLRINTAPFSNVMIAPVFVAAATGELPAVVETSRGSGHLKVIDGPKPGATQVATVSLESLLARYPLKGRLKLLKSDTDGFEGLILMAALACLEKHRPVLFFEFVPDLLEQNGTNGLELLETLHGAGYSRALLYDNLGDLLLTLGLGEREHLAELYEYFRGRGAERYLDIAAFHEDDTDVFQSFRKSELEFFRSVRGGARE